MSYKTMEHLVEIGPESLIYVTEKLHGTSLLYKDENPRKGEAIYGCPHWDSDFYVYRMLQLNEDGEGVELSWTQMRGRCQVLGLKTVPLLAQFSTDQATTEQDMENLRKAVDQMAQGPSELSPTHMKKGVVLRIESPAGIVHVKSINMEEAS